MSEGQYYYKGKPVKLIYMTYVCNDKQYCTIEMVNKVNQIQRQTVQFEKLQR